MHTCGSASAVAHTWSLFWLGFELHYPQETECILVAQPQRWHAWSLFWLGFELYYHYSGWGLNYTKTQETKCMLVAQPQRWHALVIALVGV